MKALYDKNTLSIVKPRNQRWSDYNIKMPSSEILQKKGLAVIDLPENAFDGLVLPKLEDQNGSLVVVEGYVAPPEPTLNEKIAAWAEENKIFGSQLAKGFYLNSLQLGLSTTDSVAFNAHFEKVEDALKNGRLDIAESKLYDLDPIGFFTTEVKDAYLKQIQDYRAANPMPTKT